ncbi:MAG: hypothetical protein WCX65_00620 [bacterium]
MKRKFALVFAAFMIFTLQASASAASVKIVVAPGAKPCILHGVGVLENKLKASGFDTQRVEQLKSGENVEAIVIVDLSSGAAGAIEKDSLKKAESYIVKKDGGRLTGIGSDAVGAMYAAYDIAEQIEMMGASPSIAKVEPRTRIPSMDIRAINPFFHVDAFNDPKSWFYDEEYWKTYFDELSWDRYNLIDIHAMYELISTFFPNCYLYLLKSEKYPNIGISAAQAEKNLKMFNRIIDLADERGIRVSLMSYHASWKLTDADKTQEPDEKKLAEYTAEMVKKIIDMCPKLWMIGFRIGESSMNENFFKESYIKGIREADREVFMFTRSWLATPAQVLDIADAYPGRTFVEIKYNGEQLGLPYHAMTTRRRDTAASYSYESYTNWPRNYKILWQIRANGTHRLFRWGDTDFASRVMRTVQFGSAAGFSMEPMTSYYPPTDFFFKPEMKFDFFKWDHQRNWFWYMVWGRNAYNPDEPKEVWLNRFKQHYGAAGDDTYEFLKQMSKIVPLIYSWRCLGPDHRNMAPEYETGGDLNAFGKNFPLDPQSIYTIDDYTNNYLFNEQFLGAKLGPFEAADMIDKYADNARAAAERARASAAPDNVEFKSLYAEFATLEHLARYYSAKIRASAYLNFYQKKRTYPELKLAEKFSNDAIAQWDELAKTGELYFVPLLDTLRMRGQVKKTTFTWRDIEPQLEADKKIITDEMKRFEISKNKADAELAVYHIPTFKAREGEPLMITATVLGTGDEAAGLTLSYRAAGTDAVFNEVKMKRDEAGGPAYVGEIPAKAAIGKIDYFIEATSGSRKGRYPSSKSAAVLKKRAYNAEEYSDGTAKRLTREMEKLADFEKRKYATVSFTNDFAAPVFTNVEVKVNSAGDVATITAALEDTGPVANVIMYYKPIPSGFTGWNVAEMKQSGDKKFSIDVPLTPEGLLYYFNAADASGNAAAYPNFIEMTPYLVIDSWDPAINPYAK